MKSLEQWRAECSQQQLTGFEHKLHLQCGSSVISQANLNTRYSGSYHRALINSKVLHEAVKTRDYIRGSSLWGSDIDAGKEFCTELADQDGCMPVNKAHQQYAKSIPLLLERGIVFESDGRYHLPADIVVEYRSKAEGDSWITLTAKTSLPMLHQLVPQDAQNTMLKPKPIRNELATWLVLHGQQARAAKLADQLGHSDWAILLTLQQGDLNDFETLQHHYPDLPPVEVTRHYYYNNKTEYSLRKSLEQYIPEQLCKLCRLGLIGIITHNGDNQSATLSLCKEARAALKPHWKPIRQRMAKQLQQQWLAEPCQAEYPSFWSMDQQMWRIWVALHFLPMGITQQGKLRKNDLKKLTALLKTDRSEAVEFLAICMLRADLLKEQDATLRPLPINWVKWRKKMHANMLSTIRSWESWSKQDEKQAVTLLSKLPVDCWLKLDEVMEWLQTQSSGKLIRADWYTLFTEQQSIALHHLNSSEHCIYLLPEFRAVLNQKPVTFPAPGWHGADKKAKVHGYISAAGEIQLPPDCNHSVLDKLAGFCTVTSVEQMITLQLDQKALQRMGTDKAALKKVRSTLESLQSPLPQAIVYLFDKQQSQKPVAAVAATSMVVMLHEPSAIHKLHKTGFAFTQPFKDKPEIVLLDASADAHAFIHACNDDGIMLKTLIKPVEWISGTASINAWMQSNLDREDQWLEVSYQKTRSSTPKQIIACITDDYYGSIRVQPTRKTKQGYTLLKTTIQLQPKHVLRLRELDDTEVIELGLDQL